MAVLLIFAALFLACFKNFASSAYCDVNRIPFPGLKQDTTRLYLNGESFVPSCNKGYIPSAPGEKLTCKNGLWIGHFPPCTADNCATAPPFVENGKVKSFNGHHASKVEYVCDDFYFLAVESSVQCYFGEWQGTLPVCKDSRCHFTDLKEKVGVLSLNSIFTSTGENLNFECAPGYAPTAVKPLCSRGSWVEFGLSPCKENDCIVDDINNGVLMEGVERQVFKWRKLRQEQKMVFEKVKKGSSVPAGHKLQLVCESNYSFEGKGLENMTTVCSEGIWIPSPVCLLTIS